MKEHGVAEAMYVKGDMTGGRKLNEKKTKGLVHRASDGDPEHIHEYWLSVNVEAVPPGTDHQ